MMDVLGAIVNCIDLAEKIAVLVTKFKEAAERIKIIVTDVTRLQSILKDLREVLQPDPHASYTAAYLKPIGVGLEKALKAVKGCEEILNKIRDELATTLRDKSLKKKLEQREPISVNWVVRTFWIFKESSVFELREDLIRSKQDVIISLLVIQLWLTRQPSPYESKLQGNVAFILNDLTLVKVTPTRSTRN